MRIAHLRIKPLGEGQGILRQGKVASQQLTEPLGRAHLVPSPTAGERSFQRGNQAASPLLEVCH